MTFYSKLIKAAKNPELVPKMLFDRLKPYHDTIITWKFHETKNIETPAIICRVTNDNIDDALIYEPIEKVNRFRELLAQGDWGYYAYIDDQWVHRTWVTFGPKILPQMSRFALIKLSQGDAFCYWGETSTAARGKNAQPAVLSQIAEDLKNKTKNIYTSTSMENKAVYRSVSKAGYVPIRETRVISFLGIKQERARDLFS